MVHHDVCTGKGKNAVPDTLLKAAKKINVVACRKARARLSASSKCSLIAATVLCTCTIELLRKHQVWISKTCSSRGRTPKFEIVTSEHRTAKSLIRLSSLFESVPRLKQRLHERAEVAGASLLSGPGGVLLETLIPTSALRSICSYKLQFSEAVGSVLPAHRFHHHQWQQRRRRRTCASDPRSRTFDKD